MFATQYLYLLNTSHFLARIQPRVSEAAVGFCFADLLVVSRSCGRHHLAGFRGIQMDKLGNTRGVNLVRAWGWLMISCCSSTWRASVALLFRKFLRICS